MPTKTNISKLKQRFAAWNKLLEGLPPQQRRLAWLAAGVLLFALIYLAVISPLINLEDSWSQDLVRQRQLLSKYESLVAAKARVLNANKEMKGALTRLESQFLSGANAAVASADLQEILKNLTKDSGVQMTSAKVLQPREAGLYQEVPVQVQLTGNVDQLLTFIYNLEHHKKLLFIPELEINAPRWAAGTPGSAKTTDISLQVNLVVSGVIKKGVAS